MLTTSGKLEVGRRGVRICPKLPLPQRNGLVGVLTHCHQSAPRILNGQKGEPVSDMQLPPGARSIYLPDGREFADFSGSDFGVQPEWEKKDILNRGIIIQGLSEEVFEPEGSTMGPARAVLYNLIEDSADVEPYGMFFTDYGLLPNGKENARNSTVVKQVRAAFAKNGMRPFLAEMVEEKSDAHKGQTYYKLVRYVPNVTPPDAFPETKKGAK